MVLLEPSCEVYKKISKILSVITEVSDVKFLSNIYVFVCKLKMKGSFLKYVRNSAINNTYGSVHTVQSRPPERSDRYRKARDTGDKAINGQDQ